MIVGVPSAILGELIEPLGVFTKILGVLLLLFYDILREL